MVRLALCWLPSPQPLRLAALVVGFRARDVHSSYLYAWPGGLLACPSKWARRCEEREGHGRHPWRKVSHWRARLRGRAGGSVWSTVGRDQEADSSSVALGEAASDSPRRKGRLAVSLGRLAVSQISRCGLCVPSWLVVHLINRSGLCAPNRLVVHVACQCCRVCVVRAPSQ